MYSIFLKKKEIHRKCILIFNYLYDSKRVFFSPLSSHSLSFQHVEDVISTQCRTTKNISSVNCIPETIIYKKYYDELSFCYCRPFQRLWFFSYPKNGNEWQTNRYDDNDYDDDDDEDDNDDSNSNITTI